METSLPRLRRLAVSEQTFRRLALLSVVMLVVIVGSGATVRLTGSGLGCRHWPGCQPGDFFPEKGYRSDIEFSNRAVATITILATLAAFVSALKVPGAPRWLRWLAGLTFGGTAFQAPLGAITVYSGLNPWVVMSHFLLSLVVLALGVIVALEAWGIRGEPISRGLRQLGLVAAAACLLLVFSGMLATAAGPHAGNEDVRRLWQFHSAVWLHVRVTAVFAVSFLVLIALLSASAASYVRPALAVLGLLVVQMIVGEIQYRTHLPWGLVLVHVVLSSLVWAAMVYLVSMMWRPSRMTR
jgi:heme a synthase